MRFNLPIDMHMHTWSKHDTNVVNGVGTHSVYSRIKVSDLSTGSKCYGVRDRRGKSSLLSSTNNHTAGLSAIVCTYAFYQAIEPVKWCLTDYALQLVSPICPVCKR